MKISRRHFLKAQAAAALAAPFVRAQPPAPILGHGNFRYRIVPGWGTLGADTPVKNCHGIVVDREGHIVVLTDHTANNILIYEPSGKLLHKWGNSLPGAHGLSIVEEAGREVLFLTCLTTHRVLKTSLTGEVLQEWCAPESRYPNPEEFKPSWTLHLPDGGFFTLDGYGRDYILRYHPDGSLHSIFGGKEGGIVHWGPHGGMIDPRFPQNPSLLIAMSDQQHLLQLSLEGHPLRTFPLPGGNPRQIRFLKNHFFVAHLGDNWPKDRNSRGFVSVLDSEFRVISNIGGSQPEYSDSGDLLPMRAAEPVFQHPHDAVPAPDGCMYVAQFSSGNTYPIKLEPV
jgi:peptidylamidoglycolate lyase